MAYPFPSFGTFLFQRDETALDGLGGWWQYRTNEARSAVAGALTDNIVLIAVGSATREFQCYLSPTRLNELRALLYSTGQFTDWNRPLPDSRSARLDEVIYNGSVPVLCSDGVTRRRALTTVRLSSQ